MNGFAQYALTDLSRANRIDPSDPLPLYYRGCLRYSTNPQAADADFTAALKIDQSNAHILAARGVLREATGREKLAKADYAAAIRVKPQLVPTQVNLGFCYLRQRPPDCCGALKCADAALRFEGTNARAWVCKGEALRRMNSMDEAQRAFAKALHLDATCAMAFFCRGFMLAEMDENRPALYDLLSFLRCSDADQNPHLGRLKGQAYLLLEQHEEACTEFRAELDRVSKPGLAATADSAETYRLLGESFRGQGSLVEAKQHFDVAVSKAPKDVLMYISRGRCGLDMEQAGMKPPGSSEAKQKPTMKKKKKKKGQTKPKLGGYGAGALKDFTKAVSLDKTSALCWNELGVAKRSLDQEGLGFDEFTTSLSCDLRFVPALINRAPLHAALGNSQLAVHDYSRAIALDRKSIEAYVNRGVLQSQLQNHASAIADFDAALQLDPRCSVAWYNRGVCYQHLKKWDQAINDYTRALSTSPNNFRVLRNRALAYLNGPSQRPDLAKADFERALEQKSSCPELLCGLALCEHLLQRPGDAIRRYSEALQQDTKCVSALLGRGNVYLEADSAEAHGKALTDYQKAMHLYPHFVPAHVNSALALQADNRNSDAWRLFTQALSMDTLNPTALEGRALSAMRTGSTDGAYLDMSAAVTLEPQNPRLLTTHGFIAGIMADCAGAEHSFLTAARHDPSYALAHYNLALTLRSRGDLEGARAAYTKAIECGDDAGPGHYHSLLNRGVVLMELGMAAEALADFSDVVEAEPKSVAGWVNRARCFLRQRMWKKAESDYDRAVALTPLDAVPRPLLGCVTDLRLADSVCARRTCTASARMHAASSGRARPA